MRFWIADQDWKLGRLATKVAEDTENAETNDESAE